MMDTRAISQIAGRLLNWKSCSAVGCGCLSIIGIGFALVSICGALFAGGAWISPTLPTAPAVVERSAPSVIVDDAGSDQSAPTTTGSITYMPYQNSNPTWGNSLASKSHYLAWANLTGSRRTPYSRNQVLTYSNGQQMTVVAADFDYTLLKDVQGIEWACPANVDDVSALTACQRWQRGRW